MIHRRSFLAAPGLLLAAGSRIPPRTIVLTLDDAVKSHRTFVAPFLKELGFSATFFVTHNWMNDREHFMTWEDIAEIHQMGFEIGNHTWTHANFSVPLAAARLAGELALVENELKKVKVPRPVSFAYTGNFFGPEALAVLQEAGYRFARRGEMPEVEYGKAEVGARFLPSRHHRLLIPTTGDAYPNWTFEHFQNLAAHAVEGEAVVLQFHGVPDIAHPWVHTPPERFREYMLHLKREGFRVLAMRDLAPYIDLDRQPDDPLLRFRHPDPKGKPLRLPVEMEATRADLGYWSGVMRRHRYSAGEAAKVAGQPVSLDAAPAAEGPILPYPGGRHPRIGFLEGAIDPLRGTKASVFLPWDPSAYVVIDLPEAIFSDRGLLFLAHTHVPTVWNEQNKIIDNVDWRRLPEGGLASDWKLPNNVRFGATLKPRENGVAMELWLANGTDAPLTKLRTQICVLLKGAPEFAGGDKTLEKPCASVRSRDHMLSTTWEGTGRVWGNPACPCIHADPVLPDCAPGQTVRATGTLTWAGSGPCIIGHRHVVSASHGHHA
ncbi:MAG: polysaccharide deacetylase family protein [Acidobacteria bacterium]|nr:polysaccharide deacetylase family protein [Acidobacteriota bacterium]